MAGKGITGVAKAVMRGRKTPMSARKFAELRKQELEAKKEAARGIARAGDIAKSGERVAEVQRSVKAQNKETGSKRVVGKSKEKLKPVSEMTKIEKQDYDFEKFQKGLKNSLIGKARKGEPAVHDGVDYTFMLSEKRGIKPKGAKAAVAKRVKENQEEVSKRRAAGKSYGGGMKKKTVSRQAGGKMAGKPKGVGCATHGYGKAMKNS